MNEKARTIVRTILEGENVCKESIVAIMDILSGRKTPDGSARPLSRVIHRKEARQLLGCCDRSLDLLVKKGKLVRVFGIGARAIGFSEASVRALVSGPEQEVA